MEGRRLGRIPAKRNALRSEKNAHKGHWPDARPQNAAGLSALIAPSVETPPFGLGWYAAGPSALHALAIPAIAVFTSNTK
jgi:hypothetical protein